MVIPACAPAQKNLATTAVGEVHVVGGERKVPTINTTPLDIVLVDSSEELQHASTRLQADISFRYI